MARARNIKPGFFTNDLLAEIAPLGRLLFQGLWCHSDREGRLCDRPKKIKAEILPYDDCDVDSLLNELAKHNFIIRYVVGTDRFIQVVNFTKHQNPHLKEQASEIPAPVLHGACTVQEQVNTDLTTEVALLIPSSLNPITDSVVNHSVASAPESAKTKQTSHSFSHFWELWPSSGRRVAKTKCQEHWQRHGLDSVADQIIAHVAAMKGSEQWRTGFDPAPLTYLNQRRWEDGEPQGVAYSEDELGVLSAYNQILSAVWVEAVIDPFSSKRASGIRNFLALGKKPGWVEAYFSWLAENIPSKDGYGFDWAIQESTYLRAREGNFSALKAAA